MGPSLVALAKSLGKDSSSYSNSTSPSYTTFKNAVNAGKSSIFAAGVTVMPFIHQLKTTLIYVVTLSQGG